MKALGKWKKILVKKDELCLESTLFCGQVFQWKRLNGHYIGVLSSDIIEFDQKDEEILYRVINKEESDIEKMIYKYFNLDTSLVDVYKELSSYDDLYGRICKYFPGLRVITQDSFECLICFICSSNNNVQRITKMIDGICKLAGKHLGDYDGISFYSFPTLEDLKNVNEDQLRDIGFGYRAKYIVKTVSQLCELPNDYLESLKKNENYLEELTQFHGVGLKIASCIALYSLEKFDAVPMDVHMIRAGRNHYLNHKRNKQSTKGLEKGNLSKDKMIQFMNVFKDIFGDKAGWAQMALYSSQLATHEHFNFPEELRDEVMGNKRKKL